MSSLVDNIAKVEKVNLSAMRDPVGYTLIDGKKIKRGIHKEFSYYYLSLLNEPFLKELLGSKIVDTIISTDSLDDFDLTLEHPLISPRNYPYEWPLVMLKDAALLTLDLCLELNKHNTILKDASPWNILFDRTTPVLIDFTSIMPIEEDLLWVAYDQFICTFLFPLLVGYFTSGNTARAHLLADQNGFLPQQVKRLIPWRARVKFPWLYKRLFIPIYLLNDFPENTRS